MPELTRPVVEDFLYHEAELIDSWRLREWAACFREDGQYIVPTLDADPETAMDLDPFAMLCLIADDRGLIDARVDRLENIRAHAESPRSRVTHVVANVRVAASDGDIVDVLSNLIVHRWRHDRLDTYVGRCRHRLAVRDGASRSPDPAVDLCIVERRVVLDLESLDPVGPLSFIL